MSRFVLSCSVDKPAKTGHLNIKDCRANTSEKVQIYPYLTDLTKKSFNYQKLILASEVGIKECMDNEDKFSINFETLDGRSAELFYTSTRTNLSIGEMTFCFSKNTDFYYDEVIKHLIKCLIYPPIVIE